MNYTCNIIVPSLVLLFSPNFHICSQYDTLFHFSCHIFCKGAIGLFYLSCKSAFLSQFHVSFSSVVSCISLTNWPYLLLFFHSSFFSLIQFCLNSFLFIVSLYSTFSAAFTPSVTASTEFLTYHPKLFSSILIHPWQLINPFLPFTC